MATLKQTYQAYILKIGAKDEHIKELVKKSDFAGMVPLGRRGTSQDVVGAAVFLASPASQYITGTTVQVDGGLTLGAPWPEENGPTP